MKKETEGYGVINQWVNEVSEVLQSNLKTACTQQTAGLDQTNQNVIFRASKPESLAYSMVSTAAKDGQKVIQHERKQDTH